MGMRGAAKAVAEEVGPYGSHKTNPAEQYRGLAYDIVWRKLYLLSVSRFRWTGLPAEIPPRYIEKILHSSGLCVFAPMTEGPAAGLYVALSATPARGTDIYGHPRAYQLHGNGIISPTLKAADCVPIWANASGSPEVDVITHYASRLAEADRTIDINLANTRQPLIIATDPDQQLSMENFARQYFNGSPTIITTEGGGLTSLKDRIFPIPSAVPPQTVAENMGVRSRIWQEAMLMLGIQATPPEKKERVVSDEVSAADGQVLAMRASVMAEREYACDMINRKYGLNVGVEWNLTADMAKGIISDGDTLAEAVNPEL